MTLYEFILKTLERRKLAFVRRYASFYACSIGCHLFNLVNREQQIYTEAGMIPDMRMHIMLVAPPGFSKSLWLRQYLDGMYSLLYDSVIPIGFEGFMTEAGFVGTIKFKKGETKGEGDDLVEKRLGAAFHYRKGIMGVEEFSGLAQGMQGTSGGGLDNALLTVLDGGKAVKRLAAGKIEYHTSVTLWTGTQPARFNLASGLGRRFFFMQFVPTRKDMIIIRTRRRLGKGISPDISRLNALRGRIALLQKKIEKIQRIEFTEELYDKMDSLNIIHYEEMLYERMCLGYHVLNENFDDKLIINVDKKLSRMIDWEWNWRLHLKRGSETSQVLSILNDHEGMMRERELRVKLLDFGVDWQHGTELIRRATKGGLIKVEDGYIKLRFKVKKSKKVKMK